MSRRRAMTRSIRRISLLLLGVTSFCALVAVPANAEPPEVAPEPRAVYDLAVPPPTEPVDKYKIDKDRFSLAGVEDDAPLRSEKENVQEFDAYNEIVLHVHQFTASELENRANRDVMFLDLVKPVRRDYQYQLVWFEGRLKRLRRMEPSKPLKNAGIADLYEAWVFPRAGADPICVVLTQLPAGVEPSIEYIPPKPVTFAGYSFKLFHYESTATDPKDATKHVVRKAPLLIAKSVTVGPEPDSDGGKPWREGFLPGMLAIVGGIAVVGLALTVWFRRGDKKVRKQMEHRRGHNPFQGSLAKTDAGSD